MQNYVRCLSSRGWLLLAIALVSVGAYASAIVFSPPSPALAQAAPTTWTVYAGFGVSETGRPATERREFVAYSNDFQPRPLEIRVGDTIEFQNNGFHTITLGRDRIDPFDPSTGIPNPEVAFPEGGNVYDGSGVVNSGILEGPAVFPVTFTKPGQYRVHCDVHAQALPEVGMAMTVTVKPADQPLAMTPAQAETAAMQHYLADWTNRALPRMAQASTVKVASTADGGWAYEISAGFGDGHVEGLRFLPQSLVVKAGEWVKWVNHDPEVPHTVTLLPGGGLPDPNLPPPEGEMNPFVSSGGNVYTGDNMVSLAVIGNPRFAGPGTGDSGMIQFATPGTYTMHCILHLHDGMVGSITVLP